MYLTEKEIIYPTDERFDLIKELCHLSKNLYNASLYDVRQYYFETKSYRTWQSQRPIFTKNHNPDYYALPADLAGEVLMQVGRQFISFFNNKSNKKKRVPKYKDKNGYNVITFPKRTISKYIESDIHKNKYIHDEDYSMQEALKRGEYVEQRVEYARTVEKLDSKSLYYDETIEDYSPERKALHNRLLREALDKYKDVPCEAKVFMSGGISGAGKTTILSKMGIDFQNYATVSSDDFKELLAREDAIPHVEGLTPMEASSLVHEESYHLADRLLLNLANQRKNLIYDFTMKSESTTMTRIGTLNNFGYQNEDIRIVFVDVPLSVSKGRAKTRYMVGLNNFDLGGRWVPSFVADKQKAKTNRFNTANAETLVTMGSKLEAEGFPTPIVYDNTDVAKKIDFNEFRKGYRE